jgi:SAM-dependent methyltransferase
MQNAKQRFTSRVADYIKARPSYPVALVSALQERYGLTPQSHIADIGSGTGLLTELFLKNGNPVDGIEPNAAMREAGEQALDHYPQFTSINASAEETTLAAQRYDFILAGQAAHWFSPQPTRIEFQRILKPGGYVVLVWNEIPKTNSPINADYNELMLRYTQPEIPRVQNSTDEEIAAFFHPNPIDHFRLKNPHTLDREQFRRRIFSSSQIPEADDPRYPELLTAIETLFSRYQKNGELTLPYQTRIYVGRFY